MKRRLLLGLAALLALALALPFWDANRFKPAIQSSLEQHLARKVEMGELRLTLLTGPGFSVSDVVIGDDPAISVEPIAYVGTLSARVSLLSLLRGKLAVSSLRLEDPSVNLTRLPDGTWNVLRLLRGGPASAPGSNGSPASTQETTLTSLEVRNGRLNFKNNGLKSTFYLSNTDIDLSASTDGIYDLWFRGSPARTDRTAQGFGLWTGRGRWLRTSSPSKLEISYELERAALSELSPLLSSRDLGLQGVARVSGQLLGPLDNLKADGSVVVQDLHYWNQTPRKSELQWKYEALLNLPAGSAHLRTTGMDTLNSDLHVQHIFENPQWQLQLSTKELPLALAGGWYRPEAPAMKNLELDGTATGEYTAGSAQPSNSNFHIQGLALKIDGQPWLQADDFVLRGAAGEYSLLTPVRFVSPETKASAAAPENLATIDALWSASAPSAKVQIKSSGLDSEHLARLAQLLDAPLAMLQDWRGGRLQGNCTVEHSSASGWQWSGSTELRDGLLRIPELAEPVTIQRAAMEFQPGQLQAKSMRGTVGKMAWEGLYRFEAGTPQPHKFDLRLLSVNLAEVERLLLPALQRERGLLARALGIGQEELPDWLAGRNAEGNLRIDSLSVGGQTLQSLSAKMNWAASQVQFNDVRATWEKLPLRGSLLVNLKQDQPAFQVNFALPATPFQSGKLSSQWSLQAEGAGKQLLASLKGTGKFEADRLLPADETGPAKLLRGEFTLASGRLSLARVQSVEGPKVTPLQVTPSPAGSWKLTSAEGKPLQLTLAPPKLDWFPTSN